MTRTTIQAATETADLGLRTADFDYDLPPELIAQTPVEPRDASRLLVVHRAAGKLEHRTFRDVTAYLRRGDVLVANDSRVLPGRLWVRKPTGGRVELLLLRPLEGGWWEALARPAQRLKPGQQLELAHPPPEGEGSRSIVQRSGAGEVGGGPPAPLDVERGTWNLEVGERTPAGGVRVRFAAPVEEVVARYGRAPLPPYIRTPLADPARYQTVYARVTGSAAAPTAGLHFTPGLLDEIAAMGVHLAFVTLHVGPDTFRPVRVERVVEHQMHAEFVAVPEAAAQAVAAARREGRRVVAVGTTVVRALESWAAVVASGQWPVASAEQRDSGHAVAEVPGVVPGDSRDAGSAPAPPDWPLATGHWPLGWSGWTRLFIYPGYRFRVVDALLTNFHLPRSTLLMLVSAFAGRELMRRAYAEAIRRRYRFFSFGDCCLLL
jgi:S-adenosylmethionine:tRNA ribosyltransferase-isomerase